MSNRIGETHVFQGASGDAACVLCGLLRDAGIHKFRPDFMETHVFESNGGTGICKHCDLTHSDGNHFPLREQEDNVNHPKHYTQHPSGVECITITEHMNFNIGNAVKYLWRADHKNGLEDLKKAAWYVNREIERQERG